ncbi:MAG: mechanosensitive ion channel [Saprospiraceae bacterium]|nr:mechanosensitive ion channel [Saprospiraceae bacterium]
MEEFWNFKLFVSGENNITVGVVVTFIASLILLIFITTRLKKFLVTRIFVKYNMDQGTSQAMASIIQYLVVILGTVIIVHNSGINLTALGLLAGALGIGVGFGLQNIASNFISGVIILFERPIKVGDRIEVGNVVGNIIKISARATTVITNDNIAIIVPNSEFVNGKVINWSLNNRIVRFNFMVMVSYKEDPAKIKKLLLEVASQNEGVLRDPPPDVLFDSFLENNLQFNLRVWSTKYSDTPKVLQSQLYYSIYEKFAEEAVSISYPQREIHIVSKNPLSSSIPY